MANGDFDMNFAGGVVASGGSPNPLIAGLCENCAAGINGGHQANVAVRQNTGMVQGTTGLER